MQNLNPPQTMGAIINSKNRTTALDQTAVQGTGGGVKIYLPAKSLSYSLLLLNHIYCLSSFLTIYPVYHHNETIKPNYLTATIQRK